MRLLKRLGLAALPALIAMALLSSSSAMAESTALCIADENPCAIANQIGYVHLTSVGKAKLLTSLGTIECEALFSGTTSASTNPLIINGNFIYTSCTSSELGSCTATEENGPSEIKVLKESHETAKVTGEGLVHLKCGTSFDCNYNGIGLIGTGWGPLLSTQTNGEITLTEKTATKETGSLLCPKTSKLDITMTPLRPTYVTTVKEIEETHETSLCSADGSGCGVTHVHETSVGNAELLTSFGTTKCEVLVLGDVKKGTNALANPLVLEVNLTYSNCLLGSTKCTATEESAPAEIKVLKEGHETAKVTGEGLVHLVCGASIDCSYNGVGLVGTGAGSLQAGQKNGEVSLSGQSVAKETGGFLCPKTSKLDITMTPLTATYISS